MQDTSAQVIQRGFLKAVAQATRSALGSRAFVPACLLAGLALRLLWVLLCPGEPVAGDPLFYYARGLDILAGKGYVWGDRPTAYWPPGYSYLLAGIFGLTGSSLLAAKLANVLLAMGSAWLLLVTARRLLHSEVAARLALLLFVLHPNQIGFVSVLFNDVLLQFLILLGVYVACTADWAWAGRAVAAGIVVGLGTLVKPLALAVYALCSLRLYVQMPFRRWLAFCAVSYAVVLLVLLPWQCRNQRVFGRFVLVTTNAGYNLFSGNSRWSNGTYVMNDEMRALLRVHETEAARDAAGRALALSYIKAHPWQFVARVPLKIYWLFKSDLGGVRYNESENAWLQNAPAVVVLLKVISKLYFFFVNALLVCGLALHLARRFVFRAPTRIDVCVFLVIAAFCLLHGVVYGAPRYHFALVPFMLMYGAYFLAALLEGDAADAEAAPA